MTPVSLLASCTDTSATSGSSRRRSPSRSSRPSRPTGISLTSCPLARAARMTAGCSTALITSGPGRMPAAPRTARLSASVPPEVKMMPPGSTPTKRGHPVSGVVDGGAGGPGHLVGPGRVAEPAAIQGPMAAAAAGLRGPVAAWSRYASTTRQRSDTAPLTTSADAGIGCRWAKLTCRLEPRRRSTAGGASRQRASSGTFAV